MNIETNPSLTLFKANAACCLRTMELLQQVRQQRLERSTQTVSEGIDETRTETAQLLEIKDWQELATLPGHAAWRGLNREVGNVQAFAQDAIMTQTSFMSGFQQVLASWQRESAQAMSEAANAMPIHTALREFFQTWTSVPTPAAEKSTR
jgi:hypothetical protein